MEILHDGKWGSVCDDEWDYLEANVVCRQLGFDGAIKPTSDGHFGQARSEIIIASSFQVDTSRFNFYFLIRDLAVITREMFVSFLFV